MAGTEKVEEEEYKREDQREKYKSREGEFPGEWYTFRVFFFRRLPREREMARGHFFAQCMRGGNVGLLQQSNQK